MNNYIKDDDGWLNNFVVEFKIYVADVFSKVDK